MWWTLLGVRAGRIPGPVQGPEGRHGAAAALATFSLACGLEENLHLRSSLTGGGAQEISAADLDAVGGVAYVADTGGGLEMVDVRSGKAILSERLQLHDLCVARPGASACRLVARGRFSREELHGVLGCHCAARAGAPTACTWSRSRGGCSAAPAPTRRSRCGTCACWAGRWPPQVSGAGPCQCHCVVGHDGQCRCHRRGRTSVPCCAGRRVCACAGKAPKPQCVVDQVRSCHSAVWAPDGSQVRAHAHAAWPLSVRDPQAEAHSNKLRAPVRCVLFFCNLPPPAARAEPGVRRHGARVGARRRHPGRSGRRRRRGG